jgi:hypothetical protein
VVCALLEGCRWHSGLPRPHLRLGHRPRPLRAPRSSSPCRFLHAHAADALSHAVTCRSGTWPERLLQFQSPKERATGRGRSGSVVCRFFPDFLADAPDDLSQVPAIFCGFTLVLNCVYVWFDCRLPAKNRVLTGRRAAALAGRKAGPLGAVAKGATSRFNFIGLFALPAAFWFIPLTQVNTLSSTRTFAMCPY